jgi:carbonic anhydrase
MSEMPAHFAKNVLFACIDDRLTESHLKFIIKIGGAFYPAVAGGGLAFINEAERATALKQVVASYAINHIDTVYLESHTGCGAYGLAGITFASPAQEVERLYTDLHQAAGYIREALEAAGAKPGEVTVHVSVVNPAGELVPEPAHAHAA